MGLRQVYKSAESRCSSGSHLILKQVTKMAASSDAAAKGPSANRLFVGNISYRVCDGTLVAYHNAVILHCFSHLLVLLRSVQITARELRLFFNEFGPVCHCQIVKDHRKGWSRG